MSDKIRDILQSNGIAPDEQALAHYGVKGMKWRKRKADDRTNNKDKLAGEFNLLTKSLEASNADDKARALASPGGLWDSTRTYTTGTGARFVDRLLSGRKEVKITGRVERSAVKQGKINKIIEDIFKKVTGQDKPKTPKSKTT